MQTVLTVQVRSNFTEWRPFTIAKIGKSQRTYFLKDMDGSIILKSANLQKIADAARHYGRTLGYQDSAFAESV
ncbi:hypothetical protein BWD09_07145 [Neisseria dentiae]|uniref:DUF1508 domain-containing protein n=1 Tax=Neisseria dentiae TaxID=194197 RepID=A0A1X3D9X6_9NEIS|nr:hypothetical protein [Neisseria dentiae]OSI16531.1 hypothetical protein BWD09_07145 [Neisseria dentiae]QMT44255.1 hypothetical protein H3L92_07095 [Neisseria dentiae]STZ49889.1 Uncharacterised protein [Neisseria dentiae]STZ49933.1 Uncharacterised protein [Neisseria dentiae]